MFGSIGAIITKKGVHLAPMYIESYSKLLERLGIFYTDEDTGMNDFVRAQLYLMDGDKKLSVENWHIRVDEDVVPEWFEKDRKKYEEEMRAAVKELMEDKYEVICGELWVKIKTDEKGTYYLLADVIPEAEMEFGSDNNYAESNVRKYLKKCALLEGLNNELGDKLVPLTIDLTSLDGVKDYGKVNGDLLGIMTLDLFRECAENIPTASVSYWLATPDSAPTKNGPLYNQCVDDCGGVCKRDYTWPHGIRPFFVIKA